MSVHVEYHFDFASPNAYLSHLLIPDIERRTSVKFDYIPVLLGGVFKATNNVSPVVLVQGVKNKGEYMQLELQRFLKKHAITEFSFNPFFPVNTLAIMRVAVAAKRLDCFERYVDAMFRHMWAEPKKLDDPAVIQTSLAASGLPASKLIELAQDRSVKQELIANTDRSVARGSFGTPSFFVGAELYFGKDRLDDVEQEIVAQQAARA